MKKVEGVGVEALREEKEVSETREALQFLAGRGALKVYEVEWTCRAQWYVVAESKDAVTEIVENMDHGDLSGLFRENELEVWVSEDQVERAENFQKQFGREVRIGEPDVGIFGGKLCDVKKFLGENIWELLESWTPSLTCKKCGHEAPIFQWRRPSQGLPRLGCPKCKRGADWREVLRGVMPPRDDLTLPLFSKDEGVADGAASRES